VVNPEPVILLVEDNDLNRDMLARRLRRAGYHVREARDAKQGLDLAQTAWPDLILMDLRLPDMSGWDAVRVLKDDPQTRHIPVIALTAHAMEGDRDRALAAGCDEYDTKPVDLPGLLEKIGELLGGSPPAGGAHDANGPAAGPLA
jgi:CheY-like chemotaxis protein